MTPGEAILSPSSRTRSAISGWPALLGLLRNLMLSDKLSTLVRRVGLRSFPTEPERRQEDHKTTEPLKGHSLDVKIDRAELRERYRSYLGGHYLSLHITVVSVVLAAAGLAAASLIARPIGTHYEQLLLWLL